MKKNDKVAIAVILAVVAVVAVAGAAITFNASSREPSLQSGDYVVYTVAGVDQASNPITGSMKVTFLNVTATGCDAKSEYTGLNIPTSYQHISGTSSFTGTADLGTKTRTGDVLVTIYGEKRVDVYVKQMSGGTMMTYAGANPLVPYKMDFSNGSAFMTFTIGSTNIDLIKNANAA